MSSQVIAFFSKRKPPSTDWSQAEIAELYRIEHALVQARFSIDTDRGMTDEGEPWFAFCRRDGEVLVHITRSNGGYLLFGMGLAQPLSGPAIGELSRAFVSRVPQNLPPQQGEGATLLVHPAAVLAILIGMIFVTQDTGYVTGYGERDIATPGTDPAAVDDPGSNGSLQQTFAKLADSIFADLGAGPSRESTLRESNDEGHKEDTYLNAVCTLAAVLMGTTVGLQASENDLQISMPLTETTTDGGDTPTDSVRAPADTEMTLLPDNGAERPMTVLAEAQASTVASPEEDTTSPVESGPTPVATKALDGPHTDDGRSQVDATPAHLTESDPAMDLPRFAPSDARMLEGSVPTPAAASDNPTSHAAQVPSPVAPTQSTHDGAAASNAHMLPSELKATIAEATTTMSATAEAILQSITTTAAKASANEQRDEVQSLPERSGDAPSDAASAAHTGDGHLYPMFDGRARDTLTGFLQANPAAQAIFYDSSVIVYDGDKDFSSRPVTVQVWEFDTGATIAIVGHADNPAHG